MNPRHAAAVLAAAVSLSATAAVETADSCAFVENKGVETTYRCEFSGTLAQAYAHFQGGRYRYTPVETETFISDEIPRDTGLPRTLPKTNRKASDSSPGDCGSYRHEYRFAYKGGNTVSVKSGGMDDCIAGDGFQTRYEKRGGKVIVTHTVFSS
ncbi:hypothetical protein [Neisseria bacilliformis]|uniref:hypothetical protein n=1 Tax=Neisseria bacilliformis TaxID=267212 RepID=UPI0002D99E5B|nr:hypothetical protein [Neisseria bacilliformis]QMT48423.1 hypothetical protein H3L91_04775 [Neisseria bacilliformis]